MINWTLAAAMAVALASPQTPPVSSTPAPQEPAGVVAEPLEDVVVEGRRLEQLVREFVGEVSAPSGRYRGLARWHGRFCVGVVNVRPEIGQAIADRVSQVGQELGLDVGAPGCRANVFVVFADDGAALADAMVEESRRAFRIGVGGLDRGNAALDDFRTADRPVRWWQLSLPVNADTGQRAVRLPGDLGAPRMSIFAPSRVTTQIRDDLKKTMVIVDVDQLGEANLAQIADYIAFVTLVQIDPEADTSRYDTILNLFDDPRGVDGLTDWDRSYLTSLYETQDLPVLRRNPRAQTRRVASEMLSERRTTMRAKPAGRTANRN